MGIVDLFMLHRIQENRASLSVGIAQGAYEAAVKYAKERQQFGRPISEFQAIQFKLADMATELEAAQLMLYSAAAKLDAKTADATKACAMAAAVRTLEAAGGFIIDGR